MAKTSAPRLPPPSPEQRKVAAGQFERANQVIATGNFDYGIRLLMSCCHLDPANLIYRQALRRTEKTKYRNNMRGSWHARISSLPLRTKIKAALRASDYSRVLEIGEMLLARNPWDTGAQLDMAEAANCLGLLDIAVWTLEQARHKDPRDTTVNRFLARLYEKRGNFAQAIALWELVRHADPRDVEAQSKSKDLAANETILRGNYEGAAGRKPESADDEDDEPAPAPSARVVQPSGENRAARSPTPQELPSAERGHERPPRSAAASTPTPPTPMPICNWRHSTARTASSIRPGTSSARASRRPATPSRLPWSWPTLKSRPFAATWP